MPGLICIDISVILKLNLAPVFLSKLLRLISSITLHTRPDTEHCMTTLSLAISFQAIIRRNVLGKISALHTEGTILVKPASLQTYNLNILKDQSIFLQNIMILTFSLSTFVWLR